MLEYIYELDQSQDNPIVLTEMNDVLSKEKRSELMRKIRSKDTGPELVVRRFLFSRGFRYRLYRTDLPGKPDIVIPRFKTIIFVHGCFWHGHACKIGSGLRRPKAHAEYWNAKIERNIERDKASRKELRALGWNVIVVWECETKDAEALDEKLNSLLALKKT